jgi:hypothetical protein
MQIHEITHQRLDEVGLMTRLGAALGNQQAKVATNTAALSQAALKQWNNQVLQLQQVNNGMPISEPEYEDRLQEFVERVMLQGRKFDTLDQTSQSRLMPAVDAVVKARMDPKLLPSAFEKMVAAVNVARQDPTKATQNPQYTPQQTAATVKQVLAGANVNTQAVATALQQAAGGTLTATKQANPMVNSLLNALGVATK